MRILIDGCDGTGKTSVCEKLANKFGCNIVRLTHDGDRNFKAYSEAMIPDNMVHDRTFLSEIIYPKYFNRDSRLDSNIIPDLFELIKLFDVKLFILTAKSETILERIGKRGDEFIDDSNKFIQINSDYVTTAMENNFVIIDTTNKTIDEIVEEIGGYLNDCR